MKALTSLLAALLLPLASINVLAESINPATVPQISPAMTPQERANLDMVLEWWRIVIQGGHMELTSNYQAEDYIQHNPNLPTGRAAFINYFQNVIGMTPAETIPAWLNPAPVVAAAKGDFVMLIFEREAPHPTEAGKTYFSNSFEILRIANGKIQEHWDSVKRVKLPPGVEFPEFEQPASQMARGSMGRLSASEERSLELATIELKDMLQYGHLELASEVMDPGYIQHNPRVPGGRDGFLQFMSRVPGRTPQEIKDEWRNPPSLTLVSGPYVFMMWDRMDPDPNDESRQYTWNHFDVVRIENDLIREHWDEAVLAAP